MKWMGERIRYEDEILATEVSTISLKSPIGMGPALNKDGETTEGFAFLGLGFITVGSVRREPNIGNMKPWMVRYEKKESMGNAMGLPSKGVEYVTNKLGTGQVDVPLIGSVVGEDTEDVLYVCSALEKYVSIIEIDSSCPTFGHEVKFEDDVSLLEDLLSKVKAVTNRPVFLKISPYNVNSQLEREKLLGITEKCVKYGVGITASNSKRIPESRLPTGSAGLSGKVLYKNTLSMIKEIVSYTHGSIPLIAVGGVSSGEDAFKLIERGADAIAIVTSFIYNGPGMIPKISRKLAELIRERGFKSVGELRGYDMSGIKVEA